MSMEATLPLGAIVGLVLTILLYVFVMPKKKDGALHNKFFQFLHNFFHFKTLYLEHVIKFIYTLATVACVSVGVLMLISVEETYTYSYYYGYRPSTESMAGYGLLLIILGPVSLRLVYEGIMLAILLVKNTMEINRKLKSAEPEVPNPYPGANPNSVYPSTNPGSYYSNTQTQSQTPYYQQQSRYSQPPVYREQTNPTNDTMR